MTRDKDRDDQLNTLVNAMLGIRDVLADAYNFQVRLITDDIELLRHTLEDEEFDKEFEELGENPLEDEPTEPAPKKHD
jgi:hypothetical protein